MGSSTPLETYCSLAVYHVILHPYRLDQTPPVRIERCLRGTRCQHHPHDLLAGPRTWTSTCVSTSLNIYVTTYVGTCASTYVSIHVSMNLREYLPSG